MKPGDWKPPLIAAIGMGIGPQCLGALAIEWIEAAQVLAGSSREGAFTGRPGGTQSDLPMGRGFRPLGRQRLLPRVRTAGVA